MKMSWKYTKDKKFKLSNFDSININIYRDDSLINTLLYKQGISYYLALNHHYLIEITKPGYYNWKYKVYTQKEDTLYTSYTPSYIDLKDFAFAFSPIQVGLSQDEYSKVKFNFRYNYKVGKFYLYIPKGGVKENVRLWKFRSLLEKNPELNVEFSKYIEQVKLKEKRIQEEKYNAKVKEQELERKTFELNQTRILAEKKEVELKLSKQENEIQALRLVEEQNKSMKKDIENIKNQKEIESLNKAQVEKELVISKKELELSKVKSENEKRESELKLVKQQELLKTEEIKNHKVYQVMYIIGLSFLVLLVAYVLRNLYNNKKKNKIITRQKEEVEEAHKEIKDSIAYAKRIQSAILPPIKLVKEYLKESFILYKPKDIVAGDFYWMQTVGKKVLFAAADCTGHGVPGAMVSVVCNNGLNRSVKEYGLTDPGQILDKTREIVLQEFEKAEDEVKDGMDIALCSLEGSKLLYAGAHNPLWIIRNGEIIETKANKQPIGQFEKPEPYTTHAFELEPGDTLYLFSDGYVDQFGGEKGKKFKSRAFKELLLSVQEKSMEDQKTIIDEVFETWKGSLGQIDDVCLIGVRV